MLAPKRVYLSMVKLLVAGRDNTKDFQNMGGHIFFTQWDRESLMNPWVTHKAYLEAVFRGDTLHAGRIHKKVKEELERAEKEDRIRYGGKTYKDLMELLERNNISYDLPKLLKSDDEYDQYAYQLISEGANFHYESAKRLIQSGGEAVGIY